MTDKDNEIINALKRCGKEHNERNDKYCKGCYFENKSPCVAFMCDRTIGLINRLQEENERLEGILDKRCDLCPAVITARKRLAEAIKLEFHKEFDELIPSIMSDRIDRLLEEMDGATKIKHNSLCETDTYLKE